MPFDLVCELPPGYDGSALRAQLAQVLDPELDQSIVDLGFVRRLQLDNDCVEVELRLPTAWCAVNFAYLMAQDVRRALLTVAGIRVVTVRLGDHCAAAAIEAAVNTGRPFAKAFPDEGGGSLEALRLTFLRKGFVIRQERLLRELRAADLPPQVICLLRFGDLTIQGDAIVVRVAGHVAVESGSATTLQRYVERRATLALDCSPAAALIIDLDGRAFSADRLERHYETARTMRVALEANGSFCRALIERAAENQHVQQQTGGRHVPA